jgi:hypothetical protein
MKQPGKRDMDAMIGGNFEKGLADMKSVVEARRGA